MIMRAGGGAGAIGRAAGQRAGMTDRMQRRTVLKLSGATALTTLFAPRAGPAQHAPTETAVLLTGLETAPEDALLAAMAPFIERDLPLALLVSPAETGAARAAFLRRLVDERPALLEVVPRADAAIRQPAYFQMRAASAARAAVTSLLGTGLPPITEPVTLATPGHGPEPPRLGGLRAAGFRSALLLPTEGSGRMPMECSAAAYCAGLARPAPLAAAPALLDRALTMGGGAPVYLTLAPGLADDDPGAPLRFATGLAAARDRAAIVPALPREIAFRATPGARRLFGLRIDAPPMAAGDVFDGFLSLTDALAEAGLAFSVVTDEPEVAARFDSACPRSPAQDAPPDGDARRDSSDCVAVAGPADAPPRETGLSLILEESGAVMTRMTGAGQHHLAPSVVLDETTAPDTALGRLSPFADAVIRVPPSAFATRARRNVLTRALADAAADSTTETRGLRDFAHALRGGDPVYDRLWQTRRMAAEIAPAPLSLAATDAARLMADARKAWQYFERMANPRTGLCDSTVFLAEDGSSIGHDRLTMWDLGSLIFANRAALDLGLIEAEDYLARSGLILGSLERATLSGARLPRSEISTSNPSSGLSDYNACDTGRLLSALRTMAETAELAEPVAALVAGWALADTIRDGQLHSITAGRMQPVFLSHCTHYATRAFGHWGIPAASPYSVMDRDTETDSEMALLYRAAEIGSIGAEPLLSEAVEFGPSPESTVLTRVLFAAQYAAFRETGTPHCVSETPLPYSPWFSYQGLRIDAQGWPFTVRVLSSASRYQTEAYQRENLMISSKAAFLWAAVYPHAYSERLLNLVRERAASAEVGFVTGIFAETGAPTRNYADMNTNGVILQAVRHMLGGRGRPSPREPQSPGSTAR